jgi:hypothetical protein
MKSSPNSHSRILFKVNDKIYRFINFSFNSNEGSLYVYFVGMPKTPKTAEQGVFDFTEQVWKEALEEVEEDHISNPKLSYHTSGQINLHMYSKSRCFGEPIYRISKTNLFLNYYIPNIETLPVYRKKITEYDHFYNIDFADEKLFSFVICPSSIKINNPDNSNYVAIYIQDLFNLVIFNNERQLKEIKLPCRDKQTLLFPEINLFGELQISPSDAVIEFYKKTRKFEGGVIEGPNSEGIYRLIFPSSDLARKYKIILEDENVETEIIDFKKGHSISLFCLKDRYGSRIKKPIMCEKIQFL